MARIKKEIVREVLFSGVRNSLHISCFNPTYFFPCVFSVLNLIKFQGCFSDKCTERPQMALYVWSQAPIRIPHVSPTPNFSSVSLDDEPFTS